MIHILCYHCGIVPLNQRKESNKTKNTGLWCSANKKTALTYTNINGYISRIQLSVKEENFYEIDCKGKGWNKLITTKNNNYSSDDIVRLVKSDYPTMDLIAFHNCIDFGGKSDNSNSKKPVTTYCILNYNIITKLTEIPVTKLTNNFSGLYKRLINNEKDTKF